MNLCFNLFKKLYLCPINFVLLYKFTFTITLPNIRIAILVLIFNIKQFLEHNIRSINFSFILCDHTGNNPACARLKKGAVPSVFEWTKVQSEAAMARQERAERRQKESTSEVFLLDEDVGVEVECATGEHLTVDARVVDNGCQTDLSGSVETSDQGTSTDKQPILSAEKLKDDAIHFYTGLETYSKFKMVLQTLGEGAFHLNYIYGAIHPISVEDQFFIVLIKLRQHKTNFELSSLFNISEADVYNIFVTWVKFMFLQWKELDMWPPQELVRFFCPTDFKAKFPNTRIIVDGTEFPIKKPKLPTAQQATFSTYKNRNTVKCLIGATPGGFISYVSPAFGGSTSDRQIVERSTLPQDCDPKDLVMADKGFDVQDIFAPFDVTVNIPTFFKQKNRMSGKCVAKDRKICSKRVHIERIIGLGKTYKILTAPMNLSETNMATEIAFVCFMLCNFRQCIIPKDA